MWHHVEPSGHSRKRFVPRLEQLYSEEKISIVDGLDVVDGVKVEAFSLSMRHLALV